MKGSRSGVGKSGPMKTQTAQSGPDPHKEPVKFQRAKDSKPKRKGPHGLDMS